MPYEFNPESFTSFTSDILAANGDQATITEHIGEMADTVTDAYANFVKVKEDLEKITQERDRLKETNAKLILRVGSFVETETNKNTQHEPERISTADYLENYFKEHDN